MFTVPLQIVGVIERKGMARDTGKPYHLRLAQCVAIIDGSPQVFEMNLSEKIGAPPAGMYDAHVAPYVDNEKRLRFRLSNLVPAARKAAA